MTKNGSLECSPSNSDISSTNISTENTNELLSKLYRHAPFVSQSSNSNFITRCFKSLLNGIRSMLNLNADSSPYLAINNEEFEFANGDEHHKHVEIHLFSLKCASCALGLENYLQSIKGINTVSVNFAAKIAFISYDPLIIESSEIFQKIKNKNHIAVIEEQRKTDTYVIYFKYDGNNSRLLHDEAIREFKITFFEVKKRNYFIRVVYNKRITGIRQIYKVLNSANPSIEFSNYSELYPSESMSDIKHWRNLLLISSIFGFITMAIMIVEIYLSYIPKILIIPGLSYVNLILFMSSTIVQIFVGKYLYVSAFKTIGTGINMDFLICTATTIAYIYSVVVVLYFMVNGYDRSPHTFFETPGMLYMIVSMGRWIEAKGRLHTINSIKGLIVPQENKLVVLVNFDEKMNQYSTNEMHSQLIQENDFILVFFGMRLPFDGIIFQLDGDAFLNESIITGESMPVRKKKFHQVFSGSINEGQSFIMKVTRTGDDCRIQQISSSVKRALGKKLKISNIVDIVSKYFTPTILLLSIITFSIWMIVFMYFPDLVMEFNLSSGLEFSFQTAISVLCVACPCSIGLAIPLAIMIATGVSSKYGIFIKGGPPIQTLHQIKTLIFDKTGTLTAGTPSVEHFNITNDSIIHDLIIFYFEIVYNLVSISSHILSRTIKAYLYITYGFSSTLKLEKVEETQGKGLKCEYDLAGQTIIVLVGNEELLNMHNISVKDSIKIQINSLCKEGCIILYVCINSDILGYFVIRDEIRVDAAYTIKNLNRMGIKTIMLTGDRNDTAYFVAKSLNITEYYSRMSPEEKNNFILHKISGGEKIGMVGDGINDSIAIASSTVGISVGAGADITLETSDVVLMSNKLFDILNMIVLSRITMNTIIRNLVFASVYNLLSVPIAAGCLKWAGIDIQPWIAAIAMVLSSISVTCSSMLILLFHPVYDGIEKN